MNDWIFDRYRETEVKVIKHLKNFKFNLLVQELYHFVWNDFCDVYIELSKIYLKDKKNFEEISNNFSFIFKIVLNLVNPLIPFVSEKISKDLNYTKKNLYLEELANKNERKVFKKKSIEFYKVIELIRNLRSNLRNKKKLNFVLLISSKNKVKWIDDNENLIKMFFNINKINYLNTNNLDFDFVCSGLKFVIDYENKEKSNKDDVNKKIKFYEAEVKFFEIKLKNQNFLSKAPQKVINENKAKLKEALKNLDLLKNNNV